MSGTYYTDDFDQEMLDWIDDNKKTYKNVCGYNNYWNISHGDLIYAEGTCSMYSTTEIKCESDKYLTKEQFKLEIGMTKKKFTKDDLKTGHLVVLRDGKEYVVFKDSRSVYTEKYEYNSDTLVSLGQDKAWSTLDCYDNNLTSKTKSMSSSDIMEVYLQPHPYCFVRDYAKDERVLLWKREEKSEKELQIEEIEATIKQAQEQLSKLKQEVR